MRHLSGLVSVRSGPLYPLACPFPDEGNHVPSSVLERRRLRWGRLAVLAMAVVVLVISFDVGSTVVQAVSALPNVSNLVKTLAMGNGSTVYDLKGKKVAVCMDPSAASSFR